MRDALAKYWVIVPVTLLAAGLGWAYGGTRVDCLSWVPWLSLAILEMLLFLPPLRRGETMADARARVRYALTRDPLSYVGIALCAYLLFQCLNGGRDLMFDPDTTSWVFSPAPVSWGPFCVDPSDARPVLFWFPAALAVALGIRHGSNRRGKLVLLRVLVANGGLLGTFGLIQNLSDATKLFWMTPVQGSFFASFAYPNHAGAFFTLLFAINLGLLLQALLSKEDRHHAVWLGVALLMNLTGACLSCSWAAILTSLGLVVFGGIYALRHAWSLIDAGKRLKAVSVYIGVLVLGIGFLFFAAPENPILRELEKMPWSNPVGEMAGRRWPQTAAAFHIWRHHPWFGVGACGARRYVSLKAYENRPIFSQTWGDNVRNDPMQFLAEHGIVGFGLMLGAAVLLFIPFCRRLWHAHETQSLGRTGSGSLFLRLSPIAVTLFVGVLLIAAYSLIDLPFRSPAVLVMWVAALACAPAFLPVARGQELSGSVAGGEAGRKQ